MLIIHEEDISRRDFLKGIGSLLTAGAISKAKDIATPITHTATALAHDKVRKKLEPAALSHMQKPISRRDFIKITAANMALHPVRTVEKTKQRASTIKNIAKMFGGIITS